MEPVQKACISLLKQLESVVEAVRPHDFSRPSRALGGASIGQHVRHTIEFFQCLELGLSTGIVNYDQRAHNTQLETQHALALETIRAASKFVETTIADVSMVLHTGYGHHESGVQEIATTYFRELAYNLEHAVHHMAIIRIGMRDVAGYVELPFDFGVAASTIRHRRQEGSMANLN